MTGPHQIVCNIAQVIIGFIPNLNLCMWRPVSQASAVCEVVCQLPELQVLIVDYSTFSEESQVDRLLASIEANTPKLYSVLQVQWLKTNILQSPSKIKYVNWVGKRAHTIKRANLVLYPFCTVISL